jgi:hypothetical protein
MKKLFLPALLTGTAFFFLSCSTFEAGGGTPLYRETRHSQTGNLPTWAVELSGSIAITDSTSLGMYTSIFFPWEADIYSEKTLVKSKKSGFSGISGFEILSGPVFRLYDSKRLHIPLAAGLHAHGLVWKGFSVPSPGGGSPQSASVDQTEAKYGIGANIAAEYKLDQRFFLFGRLQLTWDFIYRTETTYYIAGSEERIKINSGLTTHLGLNPALGLGMRF